MPFLSRSATRVLTLSLLCSTGAYAQGGATSSITGVVKDTAGGVIPGASVVVSSNSTGTKFEAVTNTSGTYSVPALSAAKKTKRRSASVAPTQKPSSATTDWTRTPRALSLIHI